MRELDIHYNLWMKCQEVNAINLKQIALRDEQINKLLKINDNNQMQIELLNLQLKTKKKGGWLVPALAGMVGGLVIGAFL